MHSFVRSCIGVALSALQQWLSTQTGSSKANVDGTSQVIVGTP